MWSLGPGTVRGCLRLGGWGCRLSLAVPVVPQDGCPSTIQKKMGHPCAWALAPPTPLF